MNCGKCKYYFHGICLIDNRKIAYNNKFAVKCIFFEFNLNSRGD